MTDSENKPLLKDVTIEITNQCQLQCQHCGIWAEEERHELNASLVARMIRELLDRYEIYFFSITGGEPFLHKNLGSILKMLSFYRTCGEIKGFGVYTNAAQFERIQCILSEYGSYVKGMEIGISIDGSEETHDNLRGAGAYQQTLKTIQWIRENFGSDIIVELKFTINAKNYKELKDVYKLARRFHAKFSPKIMEIGVDDYYHRCDISDEEGFVLLTPEMIKEVERQINEILQEAYDGIDQDLLGALIILLRHGKEKIRACETPARSLFITSRREVFPCLYMPPAGKVGLDGKLPAQLDDVREKHTDNAAQGHCPRCFAYHGFLRKFNLKYLA